MMQDDPSSKLYLFQFPKLFPNYITKEPVDLTQDNKPDIKPDLKPTDAELRASNGPGRKKKAVVPQGRIGSLVVMKSGKVKVVMGDDIVMNVSGHSVIRYYVGSRGLTSSVGDEKVAGM